jgi:hypothetical protein
MAPPFYGNPVLPGPPSMSGPGVPYPGQGNFSSPPHPDSLGLLPGPGFAHSRDPLPPGPVPWPSVPLPGRQPTLSPLAEAMKIFQSGQQDPNIGSMIAFRNAYPDLQVGNYQYPGQGFPGVGPPPGWDPNVPQTTVGQISNPIGAAATLAPAAIAPHEQARMMQNLQHFAGNLPTVPLPFGLGTINPGSMAGLPTPQQQPGGYPTVPGNRLLGPSGAPMPYDPSLPVGGGNPSPGMPGMNMPGYGTPQPPASGAPLPPAGGVGAPGMRLPPGYVPYQPFPGQP